MGELWAKREVDCKAFKPFDEMFEKIYSEMKVPLSPPSLSLSTGYKVAGRHKRSRVPSALAGGLTLGGLVSAAASRWGGGG